MIQEYIKAPIGITKKSIILEEFDIAQLNILTKNNPEINHNITKIIQLNLVY